MPPVMEKPQDRVQHSILLYDSSGRPRVSDFLAILSSILWFFVLLKGEPPMPDFTGMILGPMWAAAVVFPGFASIVISLGVLKKYGNKWPLVISLIPLALFLYILVLPIQWVGMSDSPAPEINFTGREFNFRLQ